MVGHVAEGLPPLQRNPAQMAVPYREYRLSGRRGHNIERIRGLWLAVVAGNVKMETTKANAKVYS